MIQSEIKSNKNYTNGIIVILDLGSRGIKLLFTHIWAKI